MDDPNITMKEYIRLEEEKAQKRGKVFNWETAKYGKIWYNEDIHDLRSVETEFRAIAFNDKVSSEKTFSCEPTVSSLNDEIDFRISFDDSDDEDYTVIFDKNSFSYKIISNNDLKTDSENDNEKDNLPSLPSPEPTVSCLDDLDFFNDFENEFLAIVYNDALMSKSDFLTEPTISIQHIDEFNLKDETSLYEYKDNDDDKVDIEHSSGDLSVKPLPDVINIDVGAYAHGLNKLLETRDDLLYYDAEMELMNMILLSIPNEIYNSVDSYKTAKEMWARVERLMRGTIQNQVDRETRFTNDFDQFVAEPGESLVSVYNRFAQLMNDLERNNMKFPTVSVNSCFPELLVYST
ncbi:hypothetical protein Tco_0863316 [Tanacetum coccineum]